MDDTLALPGPPRRPVNAASGYSTWREVLKQDAGWLPVAGSR